VCFAAAGGTAIEFPDINYGACCYAAGMNGPNACTCWEPVYDREQAEPRRGMPQIPVPVRMCERGPDGEGGCAYRPHSPERDGDTTYQGDTEEMEELAMTGHPFFCHAGMRRVVAWRHPVGIEIPGHPADYAPPIVGGVPYQADGSPGVLCAGWLLRAATYRRHSERAQA
jgi:hypothetical protein